MPCAKISGKKIREFRLASNQTQPQFARVLSEQTGEDIDSKAVCRLENYGQRDACHPMTPSQAINEYICPCRPAQP
jgi:hypothetical protein